MLNLRVSSKKQAKIKLALQGCAGSGKTYSALLLAYGLCNDWTKIAIIDSENGSADLYAHLGAYNVLSLSDNFTPETYIQAIEICEGAGMEVIIIDSISQCWDNLLEYHAGLQGNSFTNWQKVTPRINAFMQKILQSNRHIICTMRCKQDYVLSEKNGFDPFSNLSTIPGASHVVLVVKKKKNPTYQNNHKGHGFDPWRRAWQPTPVFLPGESPWTEEPGRLQTKESQQLK